MLLLSLSLPLSLLLLLLLLSLLLLLLMLLGIAQYVTGHLPPSAATECGGRRVSSAATGFITRAPMHGPTTHARTVAR